MARLVTPPPESTPAEWGKRLAILACALIPVLLLLVLMVHEHEPMRIRWDAISLSEAPPMPVGDFLREVKAIGQFPDPLDMGQPEILNQLYEATSRHDWVARVERIALPAPGKIHMVLHFRKPVAKLQKGTQLHLVDHEGKLLLPLFPQQSEGLLSITGFENRTAANEGWFMQAVELASLLKAESNWKLLGIQIFQNQRLDEADLRIRTQSGSWIIWQTLRGTTSDELSVAEKLTRLRLYHERFGSFDVPAGYVLDVRVKDGLQRRPLTP
ncbi:MAG TPA: hypothetical protein PKA06_16105 [Gemmatales bacterium]|nr:hypothetical protein [Gemmatales bacterium]HMP16909.1 hypothetical protein [Gemmatales bacterium]